MPQVGKKVERLTLPQVKVLRALAGGGLLTNAKLAAASGCASAAEMGDLIERVELELDGGAVERAWRITAAGRKALAAADGEVRQVREGKREKPLRVGTLVPWAGGNRMAAAEVGRAMEGRPYAAVVFAGGMSELPHLTAVTVVVNDLHRHVINLARVVADPVLGPKLYRRCRRKVLHSEELADAQATAKMLADRIEGDLPRFDAAEAYFVSQWMGRNGVSGGPGEFRSPLSIRWKAGGGDSAVRYASAVKGIRAWRKILGRCTFCCLDWREFLKKVKDDPKSAVYADPPWPGLGDKMYRHGFVEGDHRDLAAALGSYSKARIVVRYLECPLAKELYPEADGWRWQRFANRNQGNNATDEVLIVREKKARGIFD